MSFKLVKDPLYICMHILSRVWVQLAALLYTMYLRGGRGGGETDFFFLLSGGGDGTGLIRASTAAVGF